MHILNNPKSYTVNETEKIFNILKKINKVKYKFLIVVNDKKIFKGTITDGDLRRNLIKNKFDKNLIASNIMEKNTLRSFSIKEKDNLLLMKKKGVFFLPILNKKKKLQKVIINLNTEAKIKIKKKLNQKIVLMAGGKGLRLRPLTNKLPKPMLKITKKRIIEKIIFDFVNQGYYDFIITVNYLKDKIKNFFGDGSKFDCKINYLEEKKYMGTAGSLFDLDLEKYDEKSIIVMNSDLITNIQYQNLINYHEKNNSDLTICSKFKDFILPFGEIEIGKNLTVKQIKEKPQKSYFVNLGIYVFKTKVIKEFKKKKFMMMNELIEYMIDNKKKILTFPVYEDWHDIGNKNDFLNLRKKYKS